jgi:hypothetical protein
MKSSTLRAGIALACALGLSACGGGSGDLYLGGSVSGITKDGLVLTNNGGNDLAVPAGAVTFQFSNRVSTDDEFDIEVKTLPSNIDHCNLFNNHARANYFTINQVQIQCIIKQHGLTVTVNGLTGAGLTIVNGSDRKDVPAGTTSVPMAQVYEDGPYAVKVLNQPAGQTCTVSGGDSGTGTGTVGSTAVTNVVVNCAAST